MILLLLSLISLFENSLCDLTFPTAVDLSTMLPINYTSIPAYSMLTFNYHFQMTNLTVVNIQPTYIDGSYDFSTFNWCDLSAYTKEGILPLLNKNNITQSDLDHGLTWAAVFTTVSQVYCEEKISISTAYTLSWDPTMSLYVQRIGAVGLIDNYITPPNQQVF